MIYTFYSFKGGVGRSMALANVGEYLASRGARVLLIDWDLEAPGLESFFFAPDDPRFAEIRCQLGLIDYLDQYRREYNGVRSSETAFEDALESLRPLEKLLAPIHPTESRSRTRGDLWLLPAGWRMSRKGTTSGDTNGADERFAKYAATVQDFGWADFYASYEGERFFTWFRNRLLAGTGATDSPLGPGFDAVLIDSRTGVTEVGGVCTRQLADVVVAFCAPNYQNLAGTERMTAAFVRSEERRQRGEDEIEVLVVPARVDEAGETDAQNEFRRQFLAAVKTPDALSESSATSWDLLIPYITKYAYAESLTVGRPDSNQRLEQAYRNLATHLVLLSRPESRLRSCLSEDLHTIRRRRPRIFVMDASAGGAAFKGAVVQSLGDLNFATHASDASSLLAVIDGPISPEAKQQIRFARQRGACVYAATEATELPAVPPILRRAPLFTLPSQSADLIRQLQAPCQSRRAPNMAPTLAPGYVELPEHLERLKRALLQGPDASSAPPLVSLNGPPGSGKSGLAARLCMEEDVLDEYADGILWVSPGESGDVLGCLRAILTAFTGETAKETTVADAVARVAQHLVGTSCLLVIDDVVRREHVQPFLQLGSVARLVLPRDPALVPEASSIALEFMSNAQATDVLLASLPTGTDRALVSRLAYRIGGWPGALAVTRTQLAQAVSRGEPADSAVARMAAELEIGNLSVLGEAAVMLQQRARRRIDGAMKELTAPEHEILRDFRAFHDKPTVPIDSFPARWQGGEDRFRRILASFERRNLIAIDPSRDAIEIPVFVALYIRELRDTTKGSTLTAFVLRPFGFKGGIDFDLVDRDLIAPAMNQLGVRALTGGSFLDGGALREDMFQLLLTADIVVADLSVPDSDVFYDLGIRHALRPRSTILLCSATAQDGLHFSSDRLLTYVARDPASSIDALVRVVLETLASDRIDSPVFRLAPDLTPADPARVILVPAEFREDVQAARENRAAADLRLFSEEVRDLLWASEGLRLVGRAQNAIRSWEGAAETWEALLGRHPNEHEANLVLGQVYRSLNRFDDATRVIDRVLALPDLPPATRGEAQVFKGAVARRRWRDEWEAAAEKPAAALRSPRLIEAFDHYAAGFREDLNLHYAGLSALWLVTAIVELARAMPDVWQEQFETPGEAQYRLDTLGGHRRALTSAVGLALDRAMAHGTHDFWLRASVAEHRLLAGGKPGFIAAEYRKVLVDAPPSAVSALRPQLTAFEQLGVMPEGINAALTALPPSTDPSDVSHGTSTLAILFAGHMVDLPDRARQRFPAAAELRVARAVAGALDEIALRHPDRRLVGVAGGSAGGDILFHEACISRGISSIVCLPVPAREYIASSVQYAGAEWVGRFQRLVSTLPTRELSRTSDLPRWLREKPLYSTWERNLSWEIYLALEIGRNDMMLLALWDDSTTSARGGVADFVNQTKARGFPLTIIDLAPLRSQIGS